MSVTIVPDLADYTTVVPYLIPQAQNLTQVINPNNGSIFNTNGAQIWIDLPSRGFIDPKSLYMSYNMTITNPAAGASIPSVVRTPVYAPFARLDVLINSQQVESIPDWNLVASQWVDLNLGVSEKAGLQSAFGYSAATAGLTDTIPKFDGRALNLNANSYSVSGPVICNILSGCQKFIPAFAMGSIRLVFTLDSLTNYLSQGTNEPVSFSLTNFQLTYDLVDLGPEVERQVMGLEKLVIKSNSYNQSSQAIPAGTGGSQSVTFNNRFTSIRNIILSSSCPRSAVFVNGKFDSVNIATSGAAGQFWSYGIQVGGMTFPQAGPLSSNNPSAILCELRKAQGQLFDWSKSCSISNVEFGYTELGTNTQITGVAATSSTDPGKFYVGFDMNKINSSSDFMLNGISSRDTGFTVLINYGVATNSAKSLNATVNYDAVITIDTRTHQFSVLQ